MGKNLVVLISLGNGIGSCYFISIKDATEKEIKKISKIVRKKLREKRVEKIENEKK